MPVALVRRATAGLFVLLLVGSGCAGTPPDAAMQLFALQRVGGFVIEAPPTWPIAGVRIASFNGEFLFDGEGNEGQATFAWKSDPEKSRAHRDAVGRVVRTIDADVVIIPETENLHALELLNAESLVGMGYTPYLIDGQDSFTGQDVGLLARVPVDTTGRTNERVPVGITDAQYGVSKNLFARMTLAGMPVTVVGVHFLAQPDNPERAPKREAQAEVIRRLVVREQALGRQIIVMGDLNDVDDTIPDRRGSQAITNVLATIKRAGDGPADDLVSVMGEIPQSQRFTSLYDRNNDGQVGPDDLSAIDHILLSPALYARVRDVRYVHAHDPFTVSDHFPIVVTLAE